MRGGWLLKAAGLALAVAGFAHAAAADEIKLVFASQSPGGGPNSIFFNEWAKRVSDQSKGALRVEVRDGETLANFGNVYERVTNDVIQIGWIIHGIVGNKFPLSDVLSLPFIVDDNVACSAAFWRLYKSGLLDAEYRDIQPLWFGCLSTTYLHWAKDPKTTDNLNGLKFRVNNKVAGQVVQLMGGTPISLAGGEMYEALQRGTVDGVTTSWAGFEPYKLIEVTSFHLEVPIGTTPSMHFMSRKKFDSLPQAARDVLMANAGEARSREMGTYIEGSAKRARDAVIAAPDKHKLVKLTPEQLASWKARVASVTENWIKERPGGEKVVEAFTKYYSDALAGH
jgi:TRAP-type C4-dicarboxylate transport system substrate-binding protein